MKKCILAIALIFVICIGLVGCGGNSNLQAITIESFVDNWNRAIDESGEAGNFFDDKLEIEESVGDKIASSMNDSLDYLGIVEITNTQEGYERYISITATFEGKTALAMQNSLEKVLKVAYPNLSSSAVKKYGDQFFKDTQNTSDRIGYIIRIIEDDNKVTMDVKPKTDPANSSAPEEKKEASSSLSSAEAKSILANSFPGSTITMNSGTITGLCEGSTITGYLGSILDSDYDVSYYLVSKATGIIYEASDMNNLRKVN